MVASAAPVTPMSKPKMRSGSRARLRIPPVVRPIMAKKALDWKRSWLLSTRDAHI